MMDINYIYLTDDLAVRDDFLESERFIPYTQKGYITSNQDETNQDECDIQDDKSNFSANKIVFILENKNEYHSYKPAYDSDTLYEIDPKISYKNAAENLCNNDKIKFAFIGLNSSNDFFCKIIKEGIPFAFISPKYKKCEWLKLKIDKNDCQKGGCIVCDAYSKGWANCIDHNVRYSEGEGERLFKNYVRKILIAINRISNPIKSIPIFEFSTALDIVRWFNFNQQMQHAIELADYSNDLEILKSNEFESFFGQDETDKIGMMLHLLRKKKRQGKW